ncbi:hypothetical protein [Saccharothrix syringae]|uniref:Uncharacterized protein n=1 Tax=Saccharothrix syringae TaxID=103733 RepID=A0A5Q0HAX2_SACSY|nr:hypothetical protein [Saccharothrix syringae]QFZ23396.1 hypothetical protein EKG83_43485 [Saccharothrix syringae]
MSVAELIRKQPTPLRLRPREPAAAHALVLDLPVEPEPPRPVGRGTKLAGVVTGVVVLLATVAAASALAGHRDAGPEPARVEAPPGIDGPAALRPDLLSAELGGGPVAPPAAGGVDPVVVDVPPAGAVLMPPPDLTPGPRPQVEVVRRFYELLPAKPAEAARLLAPELLGGDARGFTSAWARVQAITIESTAPRPGGVLAVVSMQERTGRWLRVEQLFRLSDTTVPRIVGVDVLSAQQH